MACDAMAFLFGADARGVLQQALDFGHLGGLQGALFGSIGSTGTLWAHWLKK